MAVGSVKYWFNGLPVDGLSSAAGAGKYWLNGLPYDTLSVAAAPANVNGSVSLTQAGDTVSSDATVSGGGSTSGVSNLVQADNGIASFSYIAVIGQLSAEQAGDTAVSAQPDKRPEPERYGGGGAPIWAEVSWLKKKKKPKKEELVTEVAEIVEQVAPQVTQEESRVVARRIIQQVSFTQLRQMQSLEAFIGRVEAEIAEMDDEEILLLAA